MDLSLGYYNVYDRKTTREESVYANSSASSLFDYNTDSRENDYLGSLNLEWKTKQGHKFLELQPVSMIMAEVMLKCHDIPYR